MAIKPKSIRRFTVSPGSSEEVFTQMVAGCEALWRETHLESMVKRTMKLLQNNFGIPDLSLLKLHGNGDDLWAELVPLRLKNAHIWPQKQLDAIVEQFKHMAVQEADYGSGINHLDTGGLSLCFALLGDPVNEWYVLIWTEPSAEGEENQQRNYSSDLALDFMIKQLQTTCRWLTRFSETQTLLHMDDLTGLYNHRYLEQAIEREIKRAQRYDSAFCLLFIDLDDFKPINDKHGHLAGSQVLREVAQILKSTLRDVDLVFRYGGDEFVILLIESDARNGLKTAQRIRERIQYTGFSVGNGATAHVTASIGVAAFPEHAQEKDRLLALADECMYESKRHGKNQVVLVGNPLLGTPPREMKDKDSWETN
ncbi:MAG TPA: GGDEF domain-containing protein [Oligoflexus sp.]|uniref:GGDEF domain-containing protein n=1 Tax=Oligoflexus sp. TaxID=1971216 RepID=UPI002D73D345|nr:GGDEF domain-containing protein [Oligoflexus sp.]HYX35446.1 GGDEF domain-containing protein [Oligoflexus sp.]